MVTIEQIRTHCRIDDDGEDTLLAQYRAAAQELLKTHTGRNWYAAGSEIPDNDPNGMHITPQAVQALLLLIGGWYQHRESAAAQNEVPAAFWHLVQAYRIYGV